MKLKIKETYLILLIVISLISLGVYSTYALFTASTEISDVVGISTTLDIGKSISEYEIVSVASGDTKLIELNVVNSSSNTIYYGAWYKIAEGNQEDIEIGLYTEVNDNPSSGTLTSSSSINLLVGITNNSNTTITIYLGVKGSTTNELNISSDKTLLPTGWADALLVTDEVLEQHKITTGESINKSYSYSESVQTDTLEPGTYKLEVWGAQGTSNDYPGGKGGYSYGTLNLANTTNIFIYIGGTDGTNGGGSGTSFATSYTDGCTNSSGTCIAQSIGYKGGGATDIRINVDSLYSRVIVAGGGAGAHKTYYSGDSQFINAAGEPALGFSNQGNSFGNGQSASGSTCIDKYGTTYNCSGGGGGWYGGDVDDGGSGWAYTEDNYNTWQNDKSSDASNWLLNSSYYLTNVGILGGDSSFTDYNGTTVTGHSGNGYAKITGSKIVTAYTIPQLKGLTTLNIPIKTKVDLTSGLELICENNQTSGCSIISTPEIDTSTLEAGTYIVTYKVNGIDNKKYLYNRTITIFNTLDTSGANTPDLVDGLIPITYQTIVDSEGNINTKVLKADSTNSNKLWYNYDNKRWANAVLVTNSNRSTYQSASVGTEISESHILAYYVWIPRYRYQVWNINKVIGIDSYNAQTTGIDIVFENGTNSSGTIKCTYNYNVDSDNGGIDLSTTTAENCDGSNGDYYTHPAFCLGEVSNGICNGNELRGFWIGKYELSSSNPSAEKGGGESSILKARILPNVRPWVYNYLSNFHTVLQNMKVSGNEYGLPTDNIDSHIINSYEWGAVAYLTNSKYGRCTNETCTEVSINGYRKSYSGDAYNGDCIYLRTGCGPISADSTKTSDTCNAYNTTLGMTSSTTGNVTGVYDMNGGASEIVMGASSSASGTYTFPTYVTNFSDTWYNNNTKYVTAYAYGTTRNTQEAYNRGRLGDALSETITENNKGWYNNSVSFPYSNGANMYNWLYHSNLFKYNGGASHSIALGNGCYYSDDATRAVLVSLE